MFSCIKKCDALGIRSLLNPYTVLGSILSVALSFFTSKSIFIMPSLFFIVNVQFRSRHCSVLIVGVFSNTDVFTSRGLLFALLFGAYK